MTEPARKSLRRRLPLTAWSLAFVVAGCSAERRALRKDGRELDALGELVDHYWRDVRWGDPTRASACIESAEVRLAFQEWLGEEKDRVKYVDIQVVDVKLAPEAEEPTTDGHLRTATVTVRTEGYKLPEQILEEHTLTQTWYKKDAGWYVEWP